MKKPILKFYESATVNSNEAIQKQMASKIGDPYTKTTFTEIPEDDYKRFAQSLLKFVEKIRGTVYRDFNGAFGKAIPAIKTAIFASGLLKESDEFIAAELALVLAYSWGVGGEMPKNKSSDSFRIVKDENDAALLSEKLVSFLIKKGLDIDMVGSSSIIVTYLKAILQSVICPQVSSQSPPSSPESQVESPQK